MLEIYHFSNKVTNSIINSKANINYKAINEKTKAETKKIGKENSLFPNCHLGGIWCVVGGFILKKK